MRRRAIIGPTAKSYLMAFRWHTDSCTILDAYWGQTGSKRREKVTCAQQL